MEVQQINQSSLLAFNRTAYGIEIEVVSNAGYQTGSLLIAPLMELKSGSNVHDIEQKILLIAPLMELKFPPEALPALALEVF